MSTTTRDALDVWDAVVGQDGAVRQLQAAVANPVHAYLFVGPAGSGRRAAARAFAAALLADGGAPDDAARHARLALAEAHPDLRIVEPEGSTVRIVDARALAKHATRSPAEGARKVVVGLGFQLMEDETPGMLLKVIEEPPPSTIFVLLTTELTPELETIASRSAVVEFRPVVSALIVERLVAEGVDVGAADAAAAAAAGDLERARLLAADERLALRCELWRAVPGRLDGTGARVAELVAEVQGAIDDSLTALKARHEGEIIELQDRIERYGMRGSGKRELDERHRREVRRHRTVELRFGFATMLAAYRDAVAAGPDDGHRAAAVIAASNRVNAAVEALQRAPNETLLLHALFAGLPSLRGL